MRLVIALLPALAHAFAPHPSAFSLSSFPSALASTIVEAEFPNPEQRYDPRTGHPCPPDQPMCGVDDSIPASYVPTKGYFKMKSPFTANNNLALDQLGLMPRGPKLPMVKKVANLISRLDELDTDLQRYSLLHSILETDATLYFATVLSNVPKIMPLVYTPTVGEACVNYSKIHTNQPKGIYLSKYDKGNIANVLKNWPFNSKVKVICVTDGERILGLGDLGVNGMGIPVGKLALYTALGGIEPEGTLPMHIDFGCNVDSVRNDSMYMGLKEKRPHPDDKIAVKEYDDFMEEFFAAVKEIYGQDCLVQFEDFGNSNAFRFLEMFTDKQTCFNDDIQGTAAVVLGGVMASLRITEKEVNGPKTLKDHKFVFLGAGEAGCGIATLIGETIMKDFPELTKEEAFKNIWLVDSKGLVTSTRDMSKLAHHKAPFAHEFSGDVNTLEEAVKALNPTSIIGVSGQPQTFTKEIVEHMAKTNPRPLVFSLSNPTSKSECTAEQAYAWSDGQAIFASGSPFPPVQYGGKTYTPAQGNNAYIFPGVGLGAIFAGATRLDNTDMIVAARTLANLVPQKNLDQGACYPDLKNAREVSVKIAVEIAKWQYERGTALKTRPGGDLEAAVRDRMWFDLDKSSIGPNLGDMKDIRAGEGRGVDETID